MSAIKNSFHEALVILTSHENAKTRLTKAWVDTLEHLASDELPDSIRDQFNRMRKRLTARRPVNNENPIVATIRKMSPAEAARFGCEIVNMYADVMAADHPVQLRIVDVAAEPQSEKAEGKDGVPDFLSRH
ncbi:MAG: hypothetical protein AAGA41_13125 [Pseudomonadota bacterium]